MNRIDLIKLIAENKQSPNYVEIGVFNGHVFFKVKSKYKIAIDPKFRFSFFRKIGKIIINPFNIFNRYFSKTSDDFFKQDAPELFRDKRADIALIDGMHEYAYALRDTENILNILDEDGIIIMHDCNPLTKETSVSFEEWETRGYGGLWNGNVWKVIVHLRSLRDDINVFVLDCDNGLGIITRRKPESKLHFSAEEINSLTYEQLNANRQELLNLKSPDFIHEYLKNEKITDA